MMEQLTAAREFRDDLRVPLGGGEQGRAGCFSLLVVLIAPEEIVVPTGDDLRPPFTVAVVKEDKTWGAVGTIAAMTIRYRARSPSAASQPARQSKKVFLLKRAV
jgi:hypothetical protein